MASACHCVVSTASAERDLLGCRVQALELQVLRARHRADRRLLAVSRALEPADDPRQHPGVLAVARPEELAVLVLAEPVDAVDVRQRSLVGALRHREPVREVVAHVVAAERQHRERVVTQIADATERRGGLLGAHRGADEHAVRPVARLVDQRNRRRATTSEEHGRDRDALRVLPLVGDHRALRRRGAEPGVGVGGRGLGLRRPVLALPVGEVCGRLAVHALPPDVAVVGEPDIGEDGVAGQGAHRVRVRLEVGAGCDAEQPELGVDRPQATVFTDLHPRDVVTDRLGFPARDRRDEHREVRLAARRRERGGDVVHLARGRRELEDEHVLGEPSFVTRDHRCDPQREALLAEERVAAVARAVGPDLSGLGQVDDVLLVCVARPRRVGLAGCERRTERVHAGNELAVVAEHVERGLTGAGHGAHADRHVRGIGDLHADVREGGAERPHAERHHVHRATVHAAAEQPVEDPAHLGRVLPVVRRTGVLFALGADEGAVLDPGDVRGVGGGPVRIRPLRVIQRDERPRLDELLAEVVGLLVGTIEPVDRVGLAELRDLVHPPEQALVAGWCVHGRRHVTAPLAGS